MEITTGFRLLSLFGELSGKEKASLLVKKYTSALQSKVTS
jgi:hypothetical protein